VPPLETIATAPGSAEFERCYRAVASRDARFDGWFITAVTSTGIYCRPSCPTPITPKPANVRFYPTAAAAQSAGFRACKRCRPDASPGSPEWNVRADLVGRAMRLIADGLVDREGVPGLARRLHVSERHLHRVLVASVGAGPLALARSQRAQTARTLVETTDLPFTDVAFAAGFASIRQFNDTFREVFDAPPSKLRAARKPSPASHPGEVSVRLPYRPPFDAAGLLEFLGARAVAGVEELVDGTYRRVLRLPGGPATVSLTPAEGFVQCRLELTSIADTGAAVQRARRLLDLDADPWAVADVLMADPVLATLVRATPGRRVPGHVDGSELAVRAVLGQQVSVAGARTLAARLVVALGEPLPSHSGGLTHVFPTAAALAGADPALFAMPKSRVRALHGLTAALAAGDLVLDPGSDRADTLARLVALPGIGPWTAAYVAMRALGDPDAFLPTDLGVRHAVEALGRPGDAASIDAMAEAWRPWRAYAVQHLWASLPAPRKEAR
jgi:AraC family transcriptional regulator of adaptative response / DNA-3-methyladenine glycosylase II